MVAYAEARIRIAGAGSCWLWIGPTNVDGYGVVKKVEGGWRHKLAHRLMWHLVGLEVAEGFVLDHRCRNRACVNPRHLRAIPKPLNDRQRWEHASSGPRRGVCPRGHRGQYQWRDHGARWICGECNRQNARRHRRRSRVG